MTAGRLAVPVAVVGLLLAAAPACRQGTDAAEEERRPRFTLASLDTARIHPGPAVPREGAGDPTELAGRNPYEGNIHAIQEGYRLYRWMNCQGCHADGGGAIGPALWDEHWIYGAAPAQIAESILRGRPGGMPAYGGKIPEGEVWKLVAYLQQLKPGGGLSRAGVH